MYLTHTRSQHRLGLVLAFGSLLFGGTFNALAKGLTPFLSPTALLVLSEALIVLFIVLTFGVVPLFKEFMKLSGKAIRISMLVGLINSVLAPLLWFSGLARTTAGNASLLGSVEMLTVLFFGGILLHERITKMQAIGAGVILAGVAVINFSSGSTIATVHTGDLLLVAGSAVSGTGVVLFKKHLSHIMPELAILIRSVSAVIIVLIAGVFLDHWIVTEVQAFPLEKVLLLISFAFFSRYLNLTFFYEALDRLKATTMSLIEIAAPLSGLLFAFLILGERIQSYQILGGIFIILGLAIEQVSRQSLNRITHHSIFSHLLHGTSRHAVHTRTVGILPKHV